MPKYKGAIVTKKTKFEIGMGMTTPLAAPPRPKGLPSPGVKLPATQGASKNDHNVLNMGKVAATGPDFVRAINRYDLLLKKMRRRGASALDQNDIKSRLKILHKRFKSRSIGVLQIEDQVQKLTVQAKQGKGQIGRA